MTLNDLEGLSKIFCSWTEVTERLLGYAQNAGAVV